MVLRFTVEVRFHYDCNVQVEMSDYLCHMLGYKTTNYSCVCIRFDNAHDYIVNKLIIGFIVCLVC